MELAKAVHDHTMLSTNRLPNQFSRTQLGFTLEPIARIFFKKEPTRG
jgi:hypothetical protein